MVQKPNPSAFTVGAGRSSVQIVDSRRNMKMYDLNKNEIQTLSAWNTQTLAAFSIGSFALSQAISIILSLISANPWTPQDDVLSRYALPLSAVVAIGSYIVGFRLNKSCGAILRTVEEETEEAETQRPKRRRAGNPSPAGVP